MVDLTDEQIEEIQENFDYFDTDNNGLIDYREFAQLIDALDGNMEPDVMKAGFGIIDSDHDGAIDIEEFIEWWGDR